MPLKFLNMVTPTGLKQLAYLRSLVAFAFQKNPLLYLALLISAGSVVLELAAMTILLPLATVASGKAIDVDSVLGELFEKIGVIPSGPAILLVFLGLFSLRILSQFFGQVLIQYLSKLLFRQLTTRAFHTLLTAIPLREIEKQSIGSYISLVGDESFRASTLLTNMSQLLTQILLAGLYFYAIWSYSSLIAYSVLGFLAITFLLLFEPFRVSHRLGALQIEQSHSAGSIFLDALNGLRSVRAFSAEDFVSKNYNKIIQNYMGTLFRIEAINLLTRLGPALILLLAAAAFTLYPEVLGNELADFAFAVTIVIFMLRFFPVVGQTLNIALRVVSDARAGRDVTRLVQHAVTPKPALPKTAGAGQKVGEIRIQNLDFSHMPGKPVLRDVSLLLAKGRSYAVIGRSGSGKSSLMDLLLGFAAPDAGRILIDGVSSTEISEQELRKEILLVTQDTTIFNDTLGNNIRFGADATDAEVLEACRIAGINQFLGELPMGLETLLTYRGTNLSGGQRQRIGIARALLRQPSVLLLDESTSALDATTRQQVISNLINAFRDRIIVFVTHDIHVIEAVDEVLDMTLINKVEDSQ